MDSVNARSRINVGKDTVEEIGTNTGTELLVKAKALNQILLGLVQDCDFH
jgi:hypothetical protein